MTKITVRNYLFGSIFATMIFFNLPFYTPFPYGRSFSSTLLIIAFGYAIYVYRKNLRAFFACKNYFLFCSVVYLCILILSFAWGFTTFPYTELFFSPPNQLEQSFLVKNLANMGIYLSDDRLIPFLWFRGVKGVLIGFVFTFGASYLLYCYYYRDFASLKKSFLYGLFFSLAVVIGYSIIEIFYQAGNETAENILKQTYPWFNNMKKGPIEWPPPLWPTRLRSIFSEPSYLGNYAAIAVPVLWGGTIESASTRAKAWFASLFFISTFIIFLTQSRAAYALLLGLLFLYAVLAFWLKRYRQSVALIAVLVAASFACASFFMIGFMKRDNINSIIDSNLISLTDFAEMDKKDKIRSKARYIMLSSYYKMWLERPVLGVGDFQPFAAAYSINNLTDMDKKDLEIKLWLSIQETKGILSESGLGALNAYTDRLGKTGILGLGLYLMPFLYVLYKLMSILYYVKIDRVKISNNALCDIFIMTLLICGVIASGMNAAHLMYWGPFAILGMAYVLISDKHYLECDRSNCPRNGKG